MLYLFKKIFSTSMSFKTFGKYYKVLYRVKNASLSMDTHPFAKIGLYPQYCFCVTL